MNKEEIENRIIVCEIRANGYREVGNTKTADRYDNERYKWEKLLSDLELLDERKVKELLDYRKGYFDFQQQNQKYKKVIDKIEDLLILKKARCLNEDDYILNVPDLDDILQVLKEV